MEKREFWSWVFMILMAALAIVIGTFFFVNKAVAADDVISNVATSASDSLSVSGSASVATQGNGNSQGVTINGAPAPDRITVRSTPQVYSPSINNTANCRIALSAGVSMIGWGVAAGGSTEDENCVLLETSRILYSIGQQAAAARLLCYSANPNVKAALGDVCAPQVAPLPVVQTVTAVEKEIIERVVIVPARDCKPDPIPPMYPRKPKASPVKHAC